jgi:hypothetical protein
MRRSAIVVAALALVLGWNSVGVRAQTPPTNAPPANAPPTNTPPAPGQHPSRHRHTSPTVGSLTPIPGGIVGNKKSHVYHLPGDKGKMPAEKNRVYFHSEAEAQAAGYHVARKKGSSTKSSHKSKPATPPTAPAMPPN